MSPQTKYTVSNLLEDVSVWTQRDYLNYRVWEELDPILLQVSVDMETKRMSNKVALADEVVFITKEGNKCKFSFCFKRLTNTNLLGYVQKYFPEKLHRKYEFFLSKPRLYVHLVIHICRNGKNPASSVCFLG